jgi:hypothetical protein
VCNQWRSACPSRFDNFVIIVVTVYKDAGEQYVRRHRNMDDLQQLELRAWSSLSIIRGDYP